MKRISKIKGIIKQLEKISKEIEILIDEEKIYKNKFVVLIGDEIKGMTDKVKNEKDIKEIINDIEDIVFDNFMEDYQQVEGFVPYMKKDISKESVKKLIKLLKIFKRKMGKKND